METLTIIKPDGMVGIDGKFHKIDLSDLSQHMHALQYDAVNEAGHIEWVNGSNAEITNIDDYASIVSAWESANEESIAAAADPYYYLNISDAKTLKLQELKEENDKQDAQPFEYPEGSGIKYKPSTAIERTILKNMVSGAADSDELPQNKGKWDNKDGTVSTAFTVGMLKELYETGYAIPEYNYQIYKQHAAAIMAMTSVSAVRAYNIKTGWKGVE